MKKRALLNPLGYIALYAFFGPFVFQALWGPSWAIKFFSVLIIMVGTNVLIFYVALTSALEPVETPFVQKFGKRRIQIGARIVLCAVAALLFPISFQIIKDLTLVMNGKAPEIRTEMVRQYTGFSGRSKYFFATLRFDEEPSKPEGSYHAVFFPGKAIRERGTYKFLILPNSKLILEADPIIEGNTAESK
jgi:hypothetical protein